jgi:O-antigen/teichoic acid export membrane protein
VAVASALAVSALPVFSRLASEGRAGHIGRTFLKYSAAGAALSLTVALIVTFFGRAVIVAHRPQYEPAALPLTVFAWAGVAMFQNNLSMTVLNAFGRFRAASGCAVLNLMVYAGVSLFLIPRYGALGAAQSTLITEALNMGVQLALVIPMLRGRRADV